MTITQTQLNSSHPFTTRLKVATESLLILRTIRTPVDTRTSIEVLVRLITRPRGRPVFLYVMSIVYRLVIKVVLHRSCLRPCRAISLATPWQVSNFCVSKWHNCFGYQSLQTLRSQWTTSQQCLGVRRGLRL